MDFFHIEHRPVIAIHRKGVFTLEEARNLVPIIRKITQEYVNEVESRIHLLEHIDTKQSAKIDAIEVEINDYIIAWHEKVKKLGALPKGLWLVDFDSGDGYFCWKNPEQDIDFWHKYDDGFTKRISIAEWLSQKNTEGRSLLDGKESPLL